MQLIRRNNIGQKVGTGGVANNSVSAVDVMKLLSSGNSVADMISRPATTSAQPNATKTTNTNAPKRNQQLDDALKLKIQEAITQRRLAEKPNAVTERRDQGQGGNQAASYDGNKTTTESVGSRVAEKAGMDFGKSVLGKVGLALVTGAPIASAFSPVGLMTGLANLASKTTTGYGVLDNLAATLSPEMQASLQDLTGGFITPNKLGPFSAEGLEYQEGISHPAFAGKLNSSVARAEMDADAPNNIFGLNTPGVPTMNMQTAEQVQAESIAKATAALQQSIQAAAAEAAAKAATASGNGGAGQGGNTSQTSAAAMSNPNNTQSPAQFGGNSGYGGGSYGGNGSQTSASAMSNVNNGQSPAQAGGHSGYNNGGNGGTSAAANAGGGSNYGQGGSYGGGGVR